MKTVFEKWRKNLWLTLVLLVLAALCLGVLCLYFSVTAQRLAMLMSIMKRPLLLFLNLLPPVLLCLFFFFLFNRAWLAFLVTAGMTFLLTMANWFKLQFRNDPLMFGDLLVAREAGNMLGRYSLFMTTAIALAIFLLLLAAAVLFFLARGRFEKAKFAPKWLRFALAGAVVLLCLPLSRLYLSDNVYNYKTENYDLINRWAATQVYTSKGVVYPFLHSAGSAFDTAPEGYKKADAEAELARFEDQDIPDEKKVHVIGVMLEAFNDFSKYDQIAFAQDVYADYHALEAESVCGDLVTSIFAGGTVATERSFLTGMTDLGSLRSPTNSYVWYLARQGYTVTGSHPCYNWFYNRLNINQNLGFESYLFSEGHYAELAADGAIARDNVLFPELNRLFDEHVATSDSPYFSFSVTYQGHGPYRTNANDWGEDFVQPGVYSESTENILNNYFGSVKSTAHELSLFVDHYRDLDEPVVIVIFGDHNPWLGDGNSAYTELGIDFDLSTNQGFLNYYATRYLIWFNDAAKETLRPASDRELIETSRSVEIAGLRRNEFVGDGPPVSPNFLMNVLFQLCGWKGDAYMQYTTELMRTIPVITTSGRYFAGNTTTNYVSPGDAEWAFFFNKKMEYYRRNNFQYADVIKQRQD